MEKRQCFYVREKQGVWEASVSLAYPIRNPIHKTHNTYESAYEWAASHMSGKIDTGVLPGMFYVYD